MPEVAILGADQKKRGFWGRESRRYPFSSPEPTIPTSFPGPLPWPPTQGKGPGNEVAYDPSGLRQESRALGATISGMRHCLVSNREGLGTSL